MNQSDLYKIVPESEDSDPGYVQLREDVAETTTVKNTDEKPSEEPFKFPVQSGSSKIKISLSQEQLKIKTKPLPPASSNSPSTSSKDKLNRRVSLQTPIKQKGNYKSIPVKESNNAKDWTGKVICKLCSKPFVEPRVLACLHSFCLECLQKRMDSDSDTQCELTY